MKTKYQKTNLNYNIKVKLTDFGIDVVKKRYGNDFPIDIDDEGYTEFQMWDFARIFGNHMNMVGPMVCETNVMVKVIEEEESK